MTRVSGYSLVGTPCCGATFKRSQYASVSYYVDEYWTDGFLSGTSAVGEDGLRRCTCGKVYLMHDVIDMGQISDGNVPPMINLRLEAMPKVLSQEMPPGLEIAVRRNYWWQLNHPYRIAYRLHREKVDKAAERLREAIQKPSAMRRFKALFVEPPPGPPPSPRTGPFTVPPFKATDEQRHNMERLIELQTRRENPDWLELAELYREMGRFDEAAMAISQFQKEETNISRLVLELISEREIGPMRAGKGCQPKMTKKVEKILAMIK